MPPFPNCKQHIDTHQLVARFYTFFLGQLFANPGLILELFHEGRPDVRVVLNGHYSRHLITGSSSTECSILNIQRVLVISNTGERLYSRALLPGLIIPYSRYSLQTTLYCLCRYYSGANVITIYSETGIDPRLIRKWIHMAEKGTGIAAAFFRSPDAKACSVSLDSFVHISAKDYFTANLKMLHCFINHFPKKWAAYFP